MTLAITTTLIGVKVLNLKGVAMKAKKCLVPKCIWYSAARGLCKSHYNIALKLVRARKTSWKALELLGKSNTDCAKARGSQEVVSE